MGRFQNNPSIGWLHPKFVHAHPLAWANKKLTRKPITLSISQLLILRPLYLLKGVPTMSM
jgi:hypothetical protein